MKNIALDYRELDLLIAFTKERVDWMIKDSVEQGSYDGQKIIREANNLRLKLSELRESMRS